MCSKDPLFFFKNENVCVHVMGTTYYIYLYMEILANAKQYVFPQVLMKLMAKGRTDSHQRSSGHWVKPMMYWEESSTVDLQRIKTAIVQVSPVQLKEFRVIQIHKCNVTLMSYSLQVILQLLYLSLPKQYGIL